MFSIRLVRADFLAVLLSIIGIPCNSSHMMRGGIHKAIRVADRAIVHPKYPSTYVRRWFEMPPITWDKNSLYGCALPLPAPMFFIQSAQLTDETDTDIKTFIASERMYYKNITSLIASNSCSIDLLGGNKLRITHLEEELNTAYRDHNEQVNMEHFLYHLLICSLYSDISVRDLTTHVATYENMTKRTGTCVIGNGISPENIATMFLSLQIYHGVPVRHHMRWNKIIDSLKKHDTWDIALCDPGTK